MKKLYNSKIELDKIGRSIVSAERDEYRAPVDRFRFY
jgi:hypothetical protein